MLHAIRTILGILLGMLGTVSFFGTVFMIASGEGNVIEDVAIPTGIAFVFFGLAMVAAPWLF